MQALLSKLLTFFEGLYVYQNAFEKMVLGVCFHTVIIPNISITFWFHRRAYLVPCALGQWCGRPHNILHGMASFCKHVLTFRHCLQKLQFRYFHIIAQPLPDCRFGTPARKYSSWSNQIWKLTGFFLLTSMSATIAHGNNVKGPFCCSQLKGLINMFFVHNHCYMKEISQVLLNLFLLCFLFFYICWH